LVPNISLPFLKRNSESAAKDSTSLDTARDIENSPDSDGSEAPNSSSINNFQMDLEEENRSDDALETRTRSDEAPDQILVQSQATQELSQVTAVSDHDLNEGGYDYPGELRCAHHSKGFLGFRDAMNHLRKQHPTA
jgi:hypothetical protein